MMKPVWHLLILRNPYSLPHYSCIISMTVSNSYTGFDLSITCTAFSTHPSSMLMLENQVSRALSPIEWEIDVPDHELSIVHSLLFHIAHLLNLLAPLHLFYRPCEILVYQVHPYLMFWIIIYVQNYLLSSLLEHINLRNNTVGTLNQRSSHYYYPPSSLELT